MIIAVTGHRPDKLGGYTNDTAHRAIRRHMRDFLDQAPEGELILISGGAQGIDQFWMEVGLFLELPVIAALPFEGYDSRWPVSARQSYQKLLDKCHEVRYICEPGYEARKMQIRNEWMVDNSDILVAYWNGSEGGTKNCVDFARSKGKVINVFDVSKIIADGQGT